MNDYFNKDNMDDRDIFSNGTPKEEEKDLFSYDHSNNIIDGEKESFDLNSFSSRVSDSGDKPKNSKNKKGSKKKKKSFGRRVAMGFLTFFLIGLITASIVVGSFLFYAFTMVDGTMDVNLNNLELNFTTTIYVDNGNGKYKEYRRLHGEFNRIWMDYLNPENVELPEDYDGIPQTLAKAFIAIEDKRFAEHEGVDWKRTFGAFINEFVPIYSSRQGGSTITQQLVKNLTNDNSQKASRKVREIMRARHLESKYSKDTILECYLNTIAMGNGTYGVEVASNYYFGKSVNDLTIAECACLASIAKSPTYYAPDDYPEENKERRLNVLYEMYTQGYINKEEYEKAKEEKIKIVADERVLSANDVNSYFVDALIDQVVSDLSEKYGYDDAYASSLFYNSGYRIYATVDTKIQSAAEEVFANTDYAIKGADGKKMTAGITVMDYYGNVKAVVGGIGKKTTNRGFNMATDAIRQPGSTMKPIAAYAPAIEQNLISYSSLVNDTKANYNGWTPKNWYLSYWGNITVQRALEQSVNTIPVHLVNEMTPQKSFDFLTQKLGITTLNKPDVNLAPLGMGGTNGGLTTLESAAAFAVFGNGGKYYKPSFYSKVTDQDGKTVLERENQPVTAISADTATVMNHLLQTVVYGSNGTGRAAQSYVKNMKIYAKTGTSNDQNDLWFVGGTPYYVGSCWCGYETMQEIPRAHSGIALKMWGEVMSKVHSGLEKKEFVDSNYAVKKKYCLSTGKIANSGCPKTAKGWYRTSNIPENCTTHKKVVADKNNNDNNDKGNTSSQTSSQSGSSNESTQSQNTSSGAE